MYPLLLLSLIFNGACLETDESKAVVEQYLEERKNAINENDALSFSHSIVLDQEEEQVNSLIKEMVSALQGKYLTDFSPVEMDFLTIKPIIEKSPLFHLIKKMPKGGALHLHTLSTGDAEWLVNRVLCEDNAYIYLSDDGQVLKGTLGIFKSGEVPPGYRSMKEMQNTHKEFKEWVIQMITMTAHDAAQKNPWEKFEACFARIWHLLNYEPLFRDFYQNSLEILAEDHVQIVELRAGIYELYDLKGTKYSLEDTLRIYLEILEEVRKKHPHLHLKLIISNNRKNDAAQECIDLGRAYRLRAQFPQLVKGYDLVGFETTGHTTLYYIQELLVESKQLQKKYNVQLPYFFHDGESDWITDTNIFDAVLLNSQRIGHGFNLFFFPGLFERVKKQRICIEICPISTQILGYVKDLRTHPGISYLNRGLDIVLSSDDPMLFRTRGLSYDFWEAIAAWDLSLADIKQLCINSILFSTLSENEKQDAMKIWEKDWQLFIHQTIRESQLIKNRIQEPLFSSSYPAAQRSCISSSKYI